MPEIVHRVRPTPTPEVYLANPHRGCCTFQHFNGDPLYPGTSWDEQGPTTFPPAPAAVNEGYVPTTISYCRWFWEKFEPREGEYDFTLIDKALQTCQERGQMLSVRIMAFGSAQQPQVPAWYSEKYPMVENHGKTIPFMCPDHDHPAYIEKFGGLIREFGKQFNGHPLMESVDMAYIGAWGEGAAECSRETCLRFVQLFKESFPDVTRLAMIGDLQGPVGVASGAGWRCDGFGNLKAPGSHLVQKRLSWNGMYDGLPFSVRKLGLSDCWKTGPVYFETWGVPLLWYQQGWDIDFILEQGAKFHTTYFMPKYTLIPERWRDKLEAFFAKLGYRFVFRHAQFDPIVKPGGSLQFRAWIENTGLAPIYRRYEFALRMRQGEREEILPQTHVDIREWLPGDAIVDERIQLPAWIERGHVHLSAGLVHPQTLEARVSFASREVFGDRWLSLDGFEVC